MPRSWRRSGGVLSAWTRHYEGLGDAAQATAFAQLRDEKEGEFHKKLQKAAPAMQDLVALAETLAPPAAPPPSS